MGSFALFADDHNRDPIKICLDNNDWVPFIYQEDGVTTGQHIKLIRQSLEHTGIPYRFYPVPWKRCLKGLEKGSFDAVATASYSLEREKFLHFPKDSQLQVDPSKSVGLVEYIIATHTENDFIFDSDWGSIPKPIRVPRGYSIANDIRAKKLPVDDSAINDEQNLKRLIREKTGSVITLSSVIERFNTQNPNLDLIQYQKEPLKSKMYYFAFSRKGKVNKSDSEVIWQMLAALNNKDRLEP